MPVKPPLVVLAGVATIISVGCFGAAWRSTARKPHLLQAVAPHPQPAPLIIATGGRAFTAPSTVSTSTTRSTPAQARVALPVRVEVPAVGLSAGIVPVGLTSDGDMEVPAPTVAGWYQLGPAPGAIGPAVLVGHIDSRSGPAVFYRLTALHVGDIVVVDRVDGSRARFLISAVTVVGKAAFPLDAVFAPTQGPALRLITCTGPFDPIRRHYTESLIAWGIAIP